MKKKHTELELLKGFIDALTFSAGGCWQMIHNRQDLRFTAIRDSLESIKSSAHKLISSSPEVKRNG